MGKSADMKKAADALHDAMQRFVQSDERDYVHVVESTPGHLRIIVGSARFTNTDPVERQDMVWKYLKANVPSDVLRYCWGVLPLDLDEYYEEHFPQDTSSSAYPEAGGR